MVNVVKHEKEELDGLKSIMYPANIRGVKSLTYGNKKEAKARRDYACWHIQKCNAVTVEDRGLINSTIPYLSASIDVLVRCEKCGEGIVEIKYPYGHKVHPWRNMTPQL